MSTKPSDTGRFGFTAGGVDATNIAAPSSGLRDTGYPDNGIPTAKNFNYLENLAARWRVYLSEGNFQGATTFDSTVGIAGNTSIGTALVVADFVFTADNTTDTCTKVAHGLLTGDGPIRVSNSGGALPSGIVAATDYWVIKVGADTFKFATTLANALAGTPINLTTDGTGTQTLSDTASTLRSASLTVDGSGTVNGGLTVLGNYGTINNVTTVTSGTTNGNAAIFSGSVTAVDYKFTSTHIQCVSPWAFRTQLLVSTPSLDDRASGGVPEGWAHWTSGDKIITWVPLKDGDRLNNVTFLFDKVGSSANMTFEVISAQGFGLGSSLTVLDTHTDTSSGSGITFYTTPALARTLTFESIGLRVSSGTGTHFFQSAFIEFTRP